MVGWMDGCVCWSFVCLFFYICFLLYCRELGQRTQELRLGQGDEGDNNDANRMMMTTSTMTATAKWRGEERVSLDTWTSSTCGMLI